MQLFDSPHILSVDAEGHDGNYDAPFFVMPFLEGHVCGGCCMVVVRAAMVPLRLADVRAIFDAVCSALSEIHANDLAHCDIKPANVFVSPDGSIHLLDLGVVTHFGQHADFHPVLFGSGVGVEAVAAGECSFRCIFARCGFAEMLSGVEAKRWRGRFR